MFEKLTRDEETEEVLDDLRDYRVPPEWFEYRTAAFEHMETKGGVRIAPVGYVRDDHRDVIAEIANELLRIEGTSIGIAIAVTERGTEVSVRADSQLLGEDRERIVHIIDHLLEYAFPGAPASSTSAARRIASRAAPSCPTASPSSASGGWAAAALRRTATPSSSTAGPAPAPSWPRWKTSSSRARTRSRDCSRIHP